MADTQTAKLLLTKPEVGGSNSTWGTKLNTDFDTIDAAISGTPASIASASTTDLSGTTVPSLTITGSVTITSFGAAVSGMIRDLYFTGSPQITYNGASMITPSGADIKAKPGGYARVRSLGSGNWLILSYIDQEILAAAVPVGAIIARGSSAVPNGYLDCDGSAVSRTTYADLFAVVGTSFGVGNGTTTFNVPDLRGEFLRGWDDGRGVDAGRVLGSAQAQLSLDHDHEIATSTAYTSGIGTGATADIGIAQRSGAGTRRSLVASSVSASWGAENRPRNVAVAYLIKY